jgi:signal transduction histidine kinase
MSPQPKHHRLLLITAAALLALSLWSLRAAISWYEHPFAGVLVDPDGIVSSFGMPAWDGFAKGLRYPDRIVEVDGQTLAPVEGRGYRADRFDRAVLAAFAAGRPSVHVRAETESGPRELDLTLSRLDPIAFWLNGAITILIGLLYAAGALIALAASPRGKLARTFAKTTLLAALFLFTVFDYHTTRQLVPFFHLAFALVPMGFFVLPLRLPDDVPLLERRPRLPAALDAIGLALAAGMVVAQISGATTLALRNVCSALFAASFFFFAVTFLVRFARARGDRRATLRALLLAMVPAHVVIGIAFALGALSFGAATSALLAVPALALTPLSTVVALIRHDLWGSRALLSRVLMRAVIVGLTCAFAIALGTGVATVFHVAFLHALLASAVAGLVAGLVVAPALRFGDEVLFPSRSVYKPTIAQLSDELILLTRPEDVGYAVERTVRRWLPCDEVEFRLTGEDAAASAKRELEPAHESSVDSGVRRVSPVLEAREGDKAAPGAPRDHLSLDVLFRGSVLAVLSVGKKRGGALFTSEDVDLLRTIANQAALALAHAYSYAELELRRRQQAAAWRGEREALVETVAAEIAHEVRYPINFFKSIFQRGAGDLRIEAEDVDIGCDEVERLERLVSGLRRVSSRRLERRVVRVEELVLKAERLLRDQLGARAVAIDLRGPTALRCDPDQITQVLVNLISNALDAAASSGSVGVMWIGDELGGVLTVWDDGPGFVGDPGRVFAPWYTTKPRGTGLGLAITHRIVRAHGWTISPERAGDRTKFVIEIPASDIPHGGSGESSSAASGDRGTEVA